ncbi:MAG: toll/interleukin-1 receptor domain-containing protein [Candidatus Sulfopaludibacter sp.]|nr:toll/interleukin-1 receptor domain-containing protein [Candidatus Sulfopaludibacter sp.]
MSEISAVQQLAQIVVRGLAEGKTIEIDGLGIFYPDPACGFSFEPRTAPQVFLAYVKEDEALAVQLYDTLESAGFSPWIDVRKLMPGQNWPRAIETAIETSDFFLPCFSRNSVSKWGGFQAEIRYALDCARRVPLDEIFIVPLRLDDCRVPRRIQRELQYVDLFPDWTAGVRQAVFTMQRELQRRARAHTCGKLLNLDI